MRSEKQKEEIPFFFLHFSRFFRTFAAHIVYIIIMYSDMKIETKITEAVKAIVEELYGVAVEDKLVQLGQTRPEFEGQLTLVVFPFTKMSHKAPEQTAREIGERLGGEGDLPVLFPYRGGNDDEGQRLAAEEGEPDAGRPEKAAE